MHTVAPVVFRELAAYEEHELGLSPEEISVLARTGLLEMRRGRFVFVGVGAVAIGRRVAYVLPKYENIDAGADIGVFYVRVLKRYLSNGASRTSLATSLDDIPTVMRTFEELDRYYRSAGLYRERVAVQSTAKKDKINWAKTIRRNDAIFQDVGNTSPRLYGVVYRDHVAVSSALVDGDISRLFRMVLSVLATFIAPIMRIRHPLESGNFSRIIGDLEQVVRHAAGYKRKLRAHIAAESGARRRVLKVLYGFLDADAEAVARIFGSRTFVFATLDFENVWEDACRRVIGAEIRQDLMAQPRFAPKAAARLSIGTQRTDGILEPDSDGEPTVIVDAKYYVERDGKDGIQLPLHDVVKQFGYAISARSKLDRVKIRSALVFPGKPGSVLIEDMGAIMLEHESVGLQDVDAIHCYRMDARTVFEAYVSDRLCNVSDSLRGRTVDPVATDDREAHQKAAAMQAARSQRGLSLVEAENVFVNTSGRRPGRSARAFVTIPEVGARHDWYLLVKLDENVAWLFPVDELRRILPKGGHRRRSGKAVWDLQIFGEDNEYIAKIKSASLEHRIAARPYRIEW